MSGNAVHSNFQINHRYFRDVFGEFKKKIKRLPLPKQSVPANSNEILIAARANYAAASTIDLDGFPSFGKRWGSYQADMARKIAGFADAAEVISYGQTKVNFDHRELITSKSMEGIATAERILRYEFPEFSSYIDNIQDVRFSTTGTLIRRRVNGTYRVISNIIYFHAMHILRSLQFDRSISSVCDIGGGNGNLARLWLTNTISKIDTYCIVDIAESLFFSETFLRATMPEADFVYVDKPDFQFPTPRPGKQRVILCPVQCSGAVNNLKFDLLTNTGSLGEMTDDWVAHWGRWADAQNIRYFYSHNYFGNSVERLFEGRSICAPVMSDKWALRSIGTTPALMMLQSAQRHSAELIFEKSNQHNPDLADLLRGLETSRIGYNELARIVHGSSMEQRPGLILGLVERARSNLGYYPVECLHLLRKALNSPRFVDLAANDRQQIRNLENVLSRKLLENYPQGMDAD